jgi:hypothetical protein
MRSLLLALTAAGMLAAAPQAFAQGSTVTGAAGGAVTGAVVGGPVGAVVGAFVGAAAGTAIDPPPAEVRTYVTSNHPQSYAVSGDLVVGVGVPEPVVLRPVPNYKYHYAVVNGRTVLVDPGTRRVVYIYN